MRMKKECSLVFIFLSQSRVEQSRLYITKQVSRKKKTKSKVRYLTHLPYTYLYLYIFINLDLPRLLADCRVYIQLYLLQHLLPPIQYLYGTPYFTCMRV